MASFFKLGVFVDVNGKHRAEDLFHHCHRFRILGKDNSGLDKVALGVITRPANEDFTTSSFRFLDVAQDLVISRPAAERYPSVSYEGSKRISPRT